MLCRADLHVSVRYIGVIICSDKYVYTSIYTCADLCGCLYIYIHTHTTSVGSHIHTHIYINVCILSTM